VIYLTFTLLKSEVNSYSMVEDLCLLGCSLMLDEWFLDCLTVHVKALHSFKTLLTVN